MWLTRQTKAKQKNLGSGKSTDSKKESYFTPGFKQEAAEDLQQPSFNNGYPKLYLKDSRAWRTGLFVVRARDNGRCWLVFGSAVVQYRYMGCMLI